MNGTTILLWITILIIGIIAIIVVKLHYRGAELEKDEELIIPKDTIDGILNYGQEKVSKKTEVPQFENTQPNLDNVIENNYEIYADSEVNNSNYEPIEYESQNQVLINYENQIKKTQEPMNEIQIDIMTSNNDQNEKHELKDLFTIDELIKESKRKDSEREKEAQMIQKDDEDTTEIKESIKKRQENDIEDKLIEEILADEDIEKLLNENFEEETPQEEVAEEEPQETIQDIIDNATTEEEPKETIQDIIDNATTEEEPQETISDIDDDSIEEEPKETISEIDENSTEEVIETISEEESVQDTLDVETNSEENTETEIPEPATQKDIAEAIDTASKEIEAEKIESFSESDGITESLLNAEESEEIKQPTLKSPTKIDETKSDEFGSPIDDSNLFTETEEENELDYRKDLAKITNTIKGSRLFQDVKEKLRPEPEHEVDPIVDLEESYIRNVNEFEEEDEYAPIINETHDEFGEYYEPDYDYDQAIREENTRKLFQNVKSTPEPEIAKPVETIKPKPSRNNIKIELNNTEAILKKGDEIIFRHDGETYSSQVFAINGDDISVRYRGKNITIKPEDVKKIY